MTLTPLCRALAVVALFLIAAPAWSAGDAPPPSSTPGTAGVAQAQALVQQGKFDKALDVLRPLARDNPADKDILFLIGVAATEASRKPDVAEAERDALLDEAIASLRAMLIDRPDLVRVRLELARAFFLKGEDSLSRRHFEQVLGGKPPPAVAANVRRFLSEIRARRRWSMYLGAGVAPDTNIGGTSEERIIYIHGLPFRRDAEELTKSGVGVSVWTGGEYQYPLGERLRLRAGADISRREFTGSEFDQLYVSGHVGPRWLAGENTEVSLLASARRRWTANAPEHDELGLRAEAGHRFTRRVTANARASWHDRRYRTRTFLDGPVLDLSLGGNLGDNPDRAGLRGGRIRARESRNGEIPPYPALAAGRRHSRPAARLHRGRQRRAAVDGLRGQLVPVHTRWRVSCGPDPLPARLGPQPRLHHTGLQPADLAGERGADIQRPAPRLQAHRRRAALRTPVLGLAHNGDAAFTDGPAGPGQSRAASGPCLRSRLVRLLAGRWRRAELGRCRHAAAHRQPEPVSPAVIVRHHIPMLRPLPCFWLASCSRFIACPFYLLHRPSQRRLGFPERTSN